VVAVSFRRPGTQYDHVSNLGRSALALACVPRSYIEIQHGSSSFFAFLL
jgi:hypothetical protein